MSSPADAPFPILHPDVRAWSDRRAADSLPPQDAALHDSLATLSRERGFPWVGESSGQTLELLARSIGARRVFEMGSGFGYSAFWFARAVGDQGEVHGSEKDPWELEHFERLWADHPYKQRVHLAQAGAFEALEATTGPFDIVFVDINKADYPAALEAALPRLRPGGMVLTDNVLWGGKACMEPSPDDTDSTRAVRRYNALTAADPRLLSVVLPVGDGLGVSLLLPS